MRERGLSIDHTTIFRWVQRSAPELEKRCRPHLKAYTDSWKVDETYIKAKKVTRPIPKPRPRSKQGEFFPSQSNSGR